MSSTKSPNRLSSDWIEKGQTILNDLIKKNKNGSILVFNHLGDLIFKSGKKISLDTTPFGALVTGYVAARVQIEKWMKLPTVRQLLGNKKKFCWIEKQGDWIVVGLNINPKVDLKKITQHLKKWGASNSKEKSHSDFGELTEIAIDSAFKNSGMS